MDGGGFAGVEAAIQLRKARLEVTLVSDRPFPGCEDMGNGAAWVHRDGAAERMVPLPVVGHWLKQGWGTYFKLSKRRLVPRLFGM